jgi:hypothetical protein
MDMDGLEKLLGVQHVEVTERLDRIERKFDAHSHFDKVSWAALVPMVVTIVVAVGLFS